MEKELRDKLKELEERLKTCTEEEKQNIEFTLAEMYEFYNNLIIKGILI